MSIISKRFPILADNFNGWLVLVLGLVVLLNMWVFQEGVEMPKLIVWYIGFGVALLAVAMRKGPIQLRMPKEVLAILGAFVASIIVSTVFSSDLINSVFGLYPRYANSLIFFVSWVAGLIVFSSIVTEDFFKLLKFYCFLAVLVAIWGMFQTFGIGFYEGPVASVRNLAPSFLGNPNFSAMFIATALPIIIHFAFLSVGKWKRIAYFAVIATLLASVVLFSSRGGIAATAVAFVLQIGLLLIARASKWRVIFLTSLLAVFLVVAGIFYVQTRTQISGSEAGNAEITASSRLLVWDFTRTYITQNPLWGTGFGNYFLAFRSNTHPALANQEWFDDAHNVVLQLYATTGVIAGSLWLLVVLSALYYLWRSFRYNPEQRSLAIALFVAITAWFVAASFTPVAVPNWILLAMLLSACWHMTAKVLSANYVSARILGALLAVIFVASGISLLGSEYFTGSAQRHNDRGQWGEANTQSRRALLFNPLNANARLLFIRSNIQLENIEVAEKNIQMLITQHPRSAGMYQTAADYYSELYEATGEMRFKEETYAALATMIEYNSNYAFPYRVAALQMVRFGDYEKAFQYASKSLVLDGGNFNSHILMAKIYFELDNYNATINSLTAAHNKVPLKQLRTALQRLKLTGDINSISFPYNF